MSHTDHRRPARRAKYADARQDVTQVRQPRPAPRRQGTRSAVIAAARNEG